MLLTSHTFPQDHEEGPWRVEVSLRCECGFTVTDLVAVEDATLREVRNGVELADGEYIIHVAAYGLTTRGVATYPHNPGHHDGRFTRFDVEQPECDGLVTTNWSIDHE